MRKLFDWDWWLALLLLLLTPVFLAVGVIALAAVMLAVFSPLILIVWLIVRAVA